MAAPNPKNFALSASATDLGLGADLQEQLLTEEEKRKRAKQTGMAQPSAFGDSTMGSAAMMLGLGAK